MHLSFSTFAAGLTLLLRLPPLVGGAATNTPRTSVTPGRPHSLSESYQFDPRGGWEPVMVTDLHYKYRRSLTPFPEVSSTTSTSKNTSNALKRPLGTNIGYSSRKSALRSITESIAKFTKGIIGTGEAEPVTITWYTGHDLLNPSCWSKPTWAPTDKSFVAALTLDGWSGKPQCFEFLELCSNSTRQCTFARVVDTCAGCEKGSKHVDLTRAAFEQLVPLEDLCDHINKDSETLILPGMWLSGGQKIIDGR